MHKIRKYLEEENTQWKQMKKIEQINKPIKC